MKLDKDEMKELATMVADILAARETPSSNGKVLWSIRDIESFCGYSKRSTTVRKWTEDHSFPNPIARVGHRRWLREEVVDWIKKQRDDAEMMALALGLGRCPNA